MMGATGTTNSSVDFESCDAFLLYSHHAHMFTENLVVARREARCLAQGVFYTDGHSRRFRERRHFWPMTILKDRKVQDITK